MFKRTASLSLKALSAAMLLTIGGQAMAAQTYFVANVNSVLMSGDERWGGCMAALSVDPQNHLPSCATTWVSFSCTGDFADPVQAYRMVDQAQLAVATNKRVLVMIQDDKKHNGYCYANRIDILR
jgi:hypothetical protein